MTKAPNSPSPGSGRSLLPETIEWHAKKVKDAHSDDWKDALQAGLLALLCFPAKVPNEPGFITVAAKRELWAAKRRSAKQSPLSEALSMVAGDAPDRAVSKREDRLIRRELLDEAVARLTAKQQLAILLRYQAGMSYAEIAETMRCTINSVGLLLTAARERLRAILPPDLSGSND